MVGARLFRHAPRDNADCRLCGEVANGSQEPMHGRLRDCLLLLHSVRPLTALVGQQLMQVAIAARDVKIRPWLCVAV